MAIDIVKIEPHKVSRDLKGYAIAIYGDPKTGKTTIGTQFPRSLLIAFEKGYSAIPGVRAAPIDTWPDMLRIMNQLQTDEAKAEYETIVIDTADLAYDAVEAYICNLHGVDAIGDLPYGKGYSESAKAFDKVLQKIRKLGYGIVLISHAQDRVITDEQGKEFNKITPTLANTPRKIVNRFVDIIGYAKTVEVPEQGEKTYLFMRGTIRFEAGSRFPYTPNKIEFSYENLVKAIADAIDKQAEQDADSVTDEKKELLNDSPLNWEETLEKFKNATQRLITSDPNNKKKIQVEVEEILGRGRRVSDLDPTSKNADTVELIIENLNKLG